MKDGETEFPPDSPVPAPVRAAYAAKVASGEKAYDNLKKMCDGMLAVKEERWSLQTCLVRKEPLHRLCVCLRRACLNVATLHVPSLAAGARHSPQ